MPPPSILRSDWLDAFVTFAEAGGFSQGARALHLSQPALHAQVKRLTEELGVALYRRAGRGIELTRAGVSVLAFARESRERSAELLAKLAASEQREAVILAAGAGAYVHLLGPAIRAFTRENVAALRLLTRDGDATLAAIRAGEAHVGVAALSSPVDDLMCTRLTEVPPVLVVPSSHRLARRRRVHVVDLDGEPLIAPPRGRPLGTTLDEAFRAAGARLAIAVEASGWELSIRFVELGLGVTIVNAFCRLPRGLVARRLAGLPAARYFVLRTRERARRDADSNAKSRLADALLAHADSWREGARAAWALART